MEYSERISFIQKDPWFQEHIARYHKLSEYKLGFHVLDIACGSGYGTKYISELGCRTIGMDQSSSTVEANKKTFKENSNLTFQVGNAEQIALPHNSFSSVISFETIEHLANPEDFLSEVRRVLKPSGLFFISTPNALVTKPFEGIPLNPYHVKEYTPQELQEILSKYFEVNSIFGQLVSPEFKLNYFWNPDSSRFLSPKYYLWSILNRMSKLAPKSADQISRFILKSPLYPESTSWIFTEEFVDSAHDLFVVCTKKADVNC